MAAKRPGIVLDGSRGITHLVGRRPHVRSQAMKQIRHVGIVGAGTMGRRIAFSCVTNGFATRLYDVTPGLAAKAVQWVREQLDARERSGALPEGAAAAASEMLEASRDLAECLRDADLALE